MLLTSQDRKFLSTSLFLEVLLTHLERKEKKRKKQKKEKEFQQTLSKVQKHPLTHPPTGLPSSACMLYRKLVEKKKTNKQILSYLVPKTSKQSLLWWDLLHLRTVGSPPSVIPQWAPRTAEHHHHTAVASLSCAHLLTPTAVVLSSCSGSFSHFLSLWSWHVFPCCFQAVTAEPLGLKQTASTSAP